MKINPLNGTNGALYSPPSGISRSVSPNPNTTETNNQSVSSTEKRKQNYELARQKVVGNTTTPINVVQVEQKVQSRIQQSETKQVSSKLEQSLELKSVASSIGLTSESLQAARATQRPVSQHAVLNLGKDFTSTESSRSRKLGSETAGTVLSRGSLPGPDGSIDIVGHSSDGGSKIEGHTPKQLAGLLKEQYGLERIQSINLVSCDSKAFKSDLQQELKALGVEVGTIEGAQGRMAVDRQTGKALDESLTGSLDQIQGHDGALGYREKSIAGISEKSGLPVFSLDEAPLGSVLSLTEQIKTRVQAGVSDSTIKEELALHFEGRGDKVAALKAAEMILPLLRAQPLQAPHQPVGQVPVEPAELNAKDLASISYLKQFGKVMVFVPNSPNYGVQSQTSRMLAFVRETLGVDREISVVTLDKKEIQPINQHIKVKVAVPTGQVFNQESFLKAFGTANGKTKDVILTPDKVELLPDVVADTTNGGELFDYISYGHPKAKLLETEVDGESESFDMADRREVEVEFEFDFVQPEPRTAAQKIQKLVPELSESFKFERMDSFDDLPDNTLILCGPAEGKLPPCPQDKKVIQVVMPDKDHDPIKRHVHVSGKEYTFPEHIEKHARFPVTPNADAITNSSLEPQVKQNLNLLIDQKTPMAFIYGLHQVPESSRESLYRGLVNGTSNLESPKRPVILVAGDKDIPNLDDVEFVTLEDDQFRDKLDEVSTKPLVVHTGNLPEKVCDLLMSKSRLVLAEGKGSISKCQEFGIPHLILPRTSMSQKGEPTLGTIYHDQLTDSELQKGYWDSEFLIEKPEEESEDQSSETEEEKPQKNLLEEEAIKMQKWARVLHPLPALEKMDASMSLYSPEVDKTIKEFFTQDKSHLFSDMVSSQNLLTETLSWLHETGIGQFKTV